MDFRIGVNLMWQSLLLCVHLVGPARAKQLVIGGKHVPGPTLLAWGALDEMVEADAVVEKPWNGLANTPPSPPSPPR